MDAHRQPRLDSRIPVEARPGKPEPGPLDVTRNLSTGGLCFQTSEPLEPGKVYELSIHLPSEEGSPPGPVSCLVRVAWRESDANGHVVGVEFARVSLADHRRIYRYLDSF